MRLLASFSGNTKKPLYTFVYGSLAALLICLFGSALFFAVSYMDKEKSRAEISKEQLLHFFNFQYPKIAEEMWTENYEAIEFRVKDIAHQFGRASHDVVLANEKGKCVYSTLSQKACDLPTPFLNAISKFKSGSRNATFSFDEENSRYTYIVPIIVGATEKGYLYAEISDPYDFYHGGTFELALRLFILPIGFSALIWVIWLYISQRRVLKPLVEMEKKQALGELAAQVAHDIRSPLVALKSVLGNLEGLSEIQRKIIFASGGRIESIANDLITQYNGKSKLDSGKTCFVYAITESIVAEKRAILTEKSNIEIELKKSSDFKEACVPISSTDMGRILSNLVNNSIEALKQSQSGLITIEVKQVSGDILVSINDNGSGMTPDTLHKLRTIGGSYGKKDGVGIGLQHVKAILAQIHGNIRIDSHFQRGTKVVLEIPSLPLPNWFAEKIDLSRAETVVVLEDDPSVRHLWEKRFEGLNVVYLGDPDQFDYALYPKGKAFYIFDQEISGSQVTGLDLIERYKLSDQAVLVTSHYDSEKVQAGVKIAGAKMIPKFMVPTIDITMPVHKYELEPKSGHPYDLILIDDERAMHVFWSYEAKNLGKAIKTVTSIEELNLDSIEKNTAIYVDRQLNGICGLTVAKRLFENGFKNIRIQTGENLTLSDVPKFIQEVRGKDFPIELFSST